MKGKKSIGSIALLLVVAAGAYLFGGVEMVYDVLGIDYTPPVINISLLETEVEAHYVFDTYDITCEDDYDDTCTVSMIGEFDTTSVGEHTVILFVKDETGNESSIDFEYTVVDTTQPVITVDGVSSVQLNGEFSWNITCEDNVDDECNVLIGTTDTSVVGEFTVSLTATDDSGNTVTIQHPYTIYVGVNTTMFTPNGYYDGIDGLDGQALVTALNLIITNHTEYPYTHSNTDVWDILREADEDPDNSDNIIMFYTGVSHPKDCQDTVTPPAFCEVTVYDEAKLTEWNREHIWSKSRGEFSDDNMTAHNDTHHLVAAERAMNSTKNNRFFEDCHDGDDTNIVDRGYGNYTCNEWEFEPRDEVKGDVARMLFYMAVRYQGDATFDDGIDLVLMDDPIEDKSLKLPVYGDLDDLLRWHLEDPVDQWEIDRNEVIYSYQGNRNPFIELPELVELIWGTSDDYN